MSYSKRGYGKQGLLYIYKKESIYYNLKDIEDSFFSTFGGDKYLQSSLVCWCIKKPVFKKFSPIDKFNTDIITNDLGVNIDALGVIIFTLRQLRKEDMFDFFIQSYQNKLCLPVSILCKKDSVESILNESIKDKISSIMSKTGKDFFNKLEVVDYLKKDFPDVEKFYEIKVK